MRLSKKIVLCGVGSPNPTSKAISKDNGKNNYNKKIERIFFE